MKIDIKEVLDMMNDHVGYKGLNNKGLKTDERDDVISRQAFNNWISEYNKEVKAGNIPGSTINGNKINQYITEYYKVDVQKIIEYFDHRLQKEFKKKTISISDDPFLSAFGLKPHKSIKDKRIPITVLKNNSIDDFSDEEIKLTIKNNMIQILNEIVHMDKIKLDAIELLLNNQTNYDIEDYLK